MIWHKFNVHECCIVILTMLTSSTDTRLFHLVKRRFSEGNSSKDILLDHWYKRLIASSFSMRLYNTLKRRVSTRLVQPIVGWVAMIIVFAYVENRGKGKLEMSSHMLFYLRFVSVWFRISRTPLRHLYLPGFQNLYMLIFLYIK